MKQERTPSVKQERIPSVKQERTPSVKQERTLKTELVVIDLLDEDVPATPAPAPARPLSTPSPAGTPLLSPAARIVVPPNPFVQFAR